MGAEGSQGPQIMGVEGRIPISSLSNIFGGSIHKIGYSSVIQGKSDGFLKA
jgi:hypothetical protein